MFIASTDKTDQELRRSEIFIVAVPELVQQLRKSSIIDSQAGPSAFISLLRSCDQNIRTISINISSLTGLQNVALECNLLEVLQRKKVVTSRRAIFTELFTEVVEVME